MQCQMLLDEWVDGRVLSIRFDTYSFATNIKDSDDMETIAHKLHVMAISMWNKQKEYDVKRQQLSEILKVNKIKDE